MSTTTSPQYPFDPTGTKPSNRVVGELQPLTGQGDRDFYCVVPSATPFFASSFSCSLKQLNGTIVPLTEGVDYYLTHHFIGATRATGKAVYGSLTFLNTSLRGTLIINPYQTVGGEWTVTPQRIASVLALRTYNPREISWDQVANYPNIFPPTPHEWNLKDMVGMSHLLEAMNGIIAAILTRASDAMTQHINDMDGTAHGITALSIGAVSLSDLEAEVRKAMDEAAMTTDEIQEGNDNKYFTENRVMAARLVGYVISNTAANLAETDTVLAALTKLQASLTALKLDVAKKANSHRPQFSGLGSQKLVRAELVTNALSLDLAESAAWRVTIKNNGSIAFNIANIGNMVDHVVEFSVTTINDNTGNAYAVAWPANVEWVDDVPPPRSTGPGAKDSWYFWSEDNCATWIGSLSNKNPT
jgi:hypothetical protein